MAIKIIFDLYINHIKGTEKGAIVHPVNTFLCKLTSVVAKGIDTPCNKVYVSTRVKKHIYDKRPAEEFDFLIEHVHMIVKYPEFVYKNKSAKRGSFCFVKEIKCKKYLCSIELIEKEGIKIYEIVTFFRTDENYLKNYELLWKWEGGSPHRNIFDTEFPQSTNTPQ